MASAFIKTTARNISVLVETLHPENHEHGQRERLRLTVPASLGTRPFVPLLAAFRERHPDTVIELRTSDRAHTHAEEWKPRSRYARSGNVAAVVCASREYWRANPKPGTPLALARHECVTANAHESWRFRDINGSLQETRIDGHLQSANLEFALQAALQDQGVVCLPLFMIADAVWSGQLVPALREYHALPAYTINIVHAAQEDVSTRAQILIDMLITQLAEDTDCVRSEPVEVVGMAVAGH